MATSKGLYDKISYLESVIESLNKDSATLETTTKNQSKQIQDYETKLNEYEEGLVREQTARKLAEAKLREFEETSGEASNKLSELTRSHQEISNKYLDCKQQLEVALPQISDLQNKVAENEEEKRDQEGQKAMKEALSKEIEERLKEELAVTSVKDKELIKNLEMESKEMSQKLEDMMSTRSTLETENETLKKELTVTTNKLQNKFEEVNFSSYDVVVDVNSLLSLRNNNGWEVTLHPGLDLEKKILQQTVIVGITGLANRGKTYLTNMLCRDKLPIGFHIRTKGLSLKYSKEEHSVASFLDSAGFETPIPFNKEEFKANDPSMDELTRKKEILNDRNSTEDFIQSYILDACNVILIVVGHLTFSDQKLIAKISEKYKKKNIFIVHNFFTLANKKDVEELIKSSILEAFEVKPMNIDKEIHRDKQNQNHEIYIDYRLTPGCTEAPEPIVHLVFAKDDSEAGDYFNETSTLYLLKQIVAQKVYKQYNLIESLIHYTHNNLKTYVTFDKNWSASTNTLAYNKEEEVIKFQEPLGFKLRAVEYDVLGERRMIIQSTDNIFEPEYTMIPTAESVSIFYDIPELDLNSTKFNLSVKPDGWFVELIGEKGSNKQLKDFQANTNTYNTRKFGLVNKIIRVAEVECKMELPKESQDSSKPQFSYVNGVLRIDIKKKKDDERKILKFGKKT